MAAIELKGVPVLAAEKVRLAERIAALRAEGVTPGLGTLLVGDDPASAKYVAMKHRNCAELGIESQHEHLPVDATQAQVEAVVERWNADAAVDAYLMQHPFPKHLDFEAALLRVDPAKDVDGLHPVNLGRLVQGVPGPRPCTPAGIQALLAHYEVPVAGTHVVVVGRGLTVGKALANLLSLKEEGANAAVTLLHTGVADIRPFVATADVLVVAAGSPGIVSRDMVKPGAAVVQTGTTIRDGTYLPDVDDDVAEVAGWFAPVTGSVGPMTRAMLLRNCVAAAERRAGREGR
ncbi:MAG: bifunctional 5,10-methylenetetrahydrofolate dehydrogenase/5,10-methenyltetrahydrofolate cyclohydrolase [Actinomycetota bacterium]|nr:bifunctional 5,10-methylenetetrahydrofolate dehydrogenase/5,10-methenyltetrahydrofolate cyclohydrolase [Actinomycetota bacterium]